MKNENILDKQKLTHPYYRIMDLESKDLENVLNSWTRDDLIKWLCWNDRNGIYKDDQSLQEIGNIITKQEAIKIIMNQIEVG